MKTLVIGDIHLENKYEGYLNYQYGTICNLVGDEEPDRTIFLGDIFHKRKPTPTEIICFKELLEDCRPYCKEIFLLRGNHDTETKAVGSNSILSIYDDFPYVTTINAPIIYNKWGYIPHYEDETIVRSCLQGFKDCEYIFAHCGFRGCFNSVGDHDFGLSVDDFSTTTILGHIHLFKQEQGGRITALGTPYPTSFREANKDSFYGIIEDGKFSLKESNIGPMYLKANKTTYSNLIEQYKDRYIILQLEVDKYEINFDLLESIKETYHNVKHIELKFEPIFNDEEQSSFSTKQELFKINESIIDRFISEANTTIPREELKDYLKMISDEYNES